MVPEYFLLLNNVKKPQYSLILTLQEGGGITNNLILKEIVFSLYCNFETNSS